ncbi:hypothetical protein P175DRAFT_0528544 [Aspergillus ochraceoroseus IBT 24754]|uniref:Aminoglycoside phosphotransferase domain-containing protein n=2 Tax=Aspergillus ochraceoroseus TaxID=138278 RepID=A0A2T5M908_9EURO|nr:uncharacterized protein P175DRAFT_0528544 [Aspergillus ochraceoroseus IBT 24754]KKK17786.1 hypothetical protein AOCH_006841 [Aspergillus ochraceoroseus]PTU25019.1 hypothetical protein P175DRAFT_0528544 [Aspergillus ochraceoroseus IBT 24754]
MTKTRRLLHEEITFSLAKEREVNVLHQLDYHDKQTRFFSLLSSRRAWSAKQNDIKLRENLFRDLSRILLRISRIPLPRIGSFIIDSDGFLCLSNRPLSIEIENLENEKIPTDIPCCYTYSTVDSYVADMLRVHDSRLRHQPNAVNNLQDCAYQMSALAAMRATAVLFFRGDFRRGPFVFTLTDLHQSNIFVDENWHITCLVDLEWACSRPIEMVEPPYWLTDKGVDEITATEYNPLRRELMAILANEESKLPGCIGPVDADARMPRFPTGLFRIFSEHIQPLLSEHGSEEIGEVMPFYWVKDVGKFVANKVSDKKKYDQDLQLAFEDSQLDVPVGCSSLTAMKT